MAKTKKSNIIKFTKEELDEIKSVRNIFSEISLRFGNLEVEKLQVEQRARVIDESKVLIENDYNKLLVRERELLDNLNKKYGAGNLDLEKGEFTPVK